MDSESNLKPTLHNTGKDKHSIILYGLGGLIYEGATEEYSYGIKLWNKHDYLMQ